MPLDILLTVAGTALIQSLFGVGVLLFGTPILLALGHDFVAAISVLLPVSFVISLSQVARDYTMIDMAFLRRILLYTIPLVILLLFIVTTSRINITMIVGVFLLLVAMKDYSPTVGHLITSLARRERLCLVVLGMVHGATNLGGSLLTAMVHNKQYSKCVTRATIAASYATFAAFQLATLSIANTGRSSNVSDIGLSVLLGLTVFLLTEATIYSRLDQQRYRRCFATFLFSSGVFLCIRSF